MRRASLVMIAAGATAALASPSSEAASGSAWLVGGWALARDQCQGDSGIVYKADGTYWAGDEFGRWSLSGTTLTYRPDGKNPSVTTIIERAPTRIKQRFADGSTRVTYKCPRNG